MLEVKVRKNFGSFALDLSASSDARVLGVVGESGSGKTTLLSCISGILAPDSGMITLSGRFLYDGNDAGRTRPVSRRGIAYVFQDVLLFPHLSVMANLRYGLGAHGSSPDFDEVVEVLQLGSLLSRGARSLSGGEARRVGIGRALLSGPKLLLLDEPLAGLDRTRAARTLHFLKRVLSTFDVHAIYVSHALSDTLFLCDEVWVLKDGSLITSGRPREVITHTGVLDEAGLYELENIFQAEPIADGDGNLCAYRIGEQKLIAAHALREGNEKSMLSIRASDIILSPVKPDRLSARNVLKGRVVRIAQLQRRVLVFVDVGEEWMVELTTSAIEELSIREGAEIFAIVKASAVSVLDASR